MEDDNVDTPDRLHTLTLDGESELTSDDTVIATSVDNCQPIVTKNGYVTAKSLGTPINLQLDTTDNVCKPHVHGRSDYMKLGYRLPILIYGIEVDDDASLARKVHTSDGDTVSECDVDAIDDDIVISQLLDTELDDYVDNKAPPMYSHVKAGVKPYNKTFQYARIHTDQDSHQVIRFGNLITQHNSIVRSASEPITMADLKQATL